MELDKRIKSLSDILTCFDIEKAKHFIGQKGYFSDYLNNYISLEDGQIEYGSQIEEYGTLTEVLDNVNPFKIDNRCHWKFFLPECCLKYCSRPFSIMEFNDHLNEMIYSDGLIHYRHKNNKFAEYTQRYNGYIVNSQNSQYTVICLGSREYSLGDLFKNFEYLDKDGIWNTFGVEE